MPRVITNKYNLPQAIVHAVTHDRYDPGDGDVSCTTLIAPAQIFQLMKDHADEIKEDASDRIWSMIGSAVHYILENACNDMKEKGLWTDDMIAERRFYAMVGGKKVSAQIDLYDSSVLNDFKVTSVFTIKSALKEAKAEWEAQLNIQRYLMSKNGIEVATMYIVAIARDWNKFGHLKDRDYPPRAIRVPIKKWTLERTEAYIQSRINALYAPVLIACTPVEMWETKPVFALMKKGGSKALRLMETKQQLLEYAEQKGFAAKIAPNPTTEPNVTELQLMPGYLIEERKRERKRCEGYCDMAPFCGQYERWVADNKRKEEEAQAAFKAQASLTQG